MPKHHHSEIEKIFEAPAQALEKSVEFIKKEEKFFINKKPVKLAEEYLETLGPGLTTGAADDDPSGIATYSQTGAQFGFKLLWLSLYTFPFMAIVQEMCARIGLVTGEGLAANIRKRYSIKVLYIVTTLLFITNTFNIAADLGAMAAATKLIAPQMGFVLLVAFFALLSLLLQIFTTYARYAKYLKYMTLSLFAYVFTAIAVHLDWGDALRHAVIPTLSFSKNELLLICAVLGTTISPYLFFWQTSQEVEERILHGEKTAEKRRLNITILQLKKMRVDIWSGMFFSNTIMFFIIAACGATLFANGITNINSASDAAIALKPFAGSFAYFFFAIGIIGTGLLAVPVLAGSTAYAISESLGWKYGLYHKLKESYAFYGIIIISMILGFIANLFGLDPIKGLIYSAVLNGLIAPIIIFFIIRLSGNNNIMGEHKNSTVINTLGWVIAIIMALAGIAVIASFF